jgi:hypothetical protein
MAPLRRGDIVIHLDGDVGIVQAYYPNRSGALADGALADVVWTRDKPQTNPVEGYMEVIGHVEGVDSERE